MEDKTILILVIILLILVGYLYTQNAKLLKIKFEHDEEERKQLEKIKQEVNVLTMQKHNLLSDVNYYEAQKNELIQEIDNQNNKLNSFRENKENEIIIIINEQNKKLNNFTSITNKAYEEYEKELEEQYNKIEDEFDQKIQELEEEKQQIFNSLNKIKESLSAGVQAQLREQEKKDSLNFYKITVSENSLSDIQILNQIKNSLHQPVILSKVIWSSYFQKPTTEMCNRVLGVDKICGIYKITNIETQQCYIGQSVDIAQRWKDHAKCGLGIDASATNKLYNNMQKYGIWNFSFELLEKCPREQLNEKEKFWIGLYQSDKFGYNSTKGNN